MSDARLPDANGAVLSLEEVTEVIQKLREDQESFLQQQRDVIIQQVLEGIHQSGVLSLTTRKKEKTPTSTSRLEQNLHALVHHSLAESGLTFPHVHNTAHEVSAQRSQGSVPVGAVKGSTKKKPIILSRREFEGGGSLSASNEDNDGSAEDNGDDISSQEGRLALSRSPLRLRDPTTRRKRGLKVEKRRRHRHNSSARVAIVDDAYTEFIDPVDAAFNAVRKKVDLRTLAILDRSKLLLGQVKQNVSQIDAKTSFVDKLRQRYRVEQSPEDSKEIETQQPPDDINQPDLVSQNGETSSRLDDELKTEEDSTRTIDPSAIRCDLELLQPPPNSPGNENEWENELARQILTIYTTSVKAKALEKSGNKQQSDNQNRAEGSASRKMGHDNNRQGTTSKASPTPARTKAMRSSCSLPVIRSSSALKRTKECTSSAVHYSWEPSQRRENGKVVINMPRVPRPIWFAGTGAVKAVWCALAEGFVKLRPQNGSPGKPSSSSSNTSLCDHRLCEEVRQLEAKKKFAQCIGTLESLLVALVRARGVDELEMKLWKQLVVTCNAFASRCIDYQKFPAGLQLMKQAEHLIDNSILVDSTTRMELLAYLYDTYAHYYYKRRKPHAGLQYILKAHEIHSKQSSWSHLAKCRLHIANLLSFQIKHAEAMKYMATILEMIEENKLEDASEGGSAQKLCLAAVCYNNLAVEQLHMREFEAASVSSANAQRLAKLCLSYSNRWLAQFQATSDCVALAIATLMEDMNANKNPLAEFKALSTAAEEQ